MLPKLRFSDLYRGFDTPILDLDCGAKCAPYNGGVPICCDTRHSVPTAYQEEWVFLKSHTDLWHLWEPEEIEDRNRLAREAGPDLVLIECLGAEHCQREYRSLVCRAFPFFPYVDSRGEFLGLSYYWEYEDRCWVMSNLGRVNEKYKNEFIRTYDQVFAIRPDERETFREHADHMRSVFAEEDRGIPLLHRDSRVLSIDPVNEALTEVTPSDLPKFGPFGITDSLLFPDEL